MVVNCIKIISKIIQRLQQLTSNQIVLQRYLQQLLVLSRLRKLEVQTKEHVKAMPITYDIKTDGLFKEGKRERTREIIIEMLKEPAMSEEMIAKFTKTSVTFVRKVKEEIKRG